MKATRRRFLAGAATLVVAPSVLTQTLTFPTGVRATLDLAATGESFRGPADWLSGPSILRRPATDTEPEGTDADLRERALLTFGGALATRGPRGG